MKILQVVLNLKYGGLEKLVIQLSEELNKKGFETVIACLQEEGEVAQEARKKGLQIFCLKKKEGFDWPLIFKLRELISREKIDIVHTHNSGPLIYGTLAARLSFKPCINTRHSRTEEKISGLIWNLNTYVVCVSDDTQKEILKHNRISLSKIRVIYNGIDLNAFNFIQDNGFAHEKRKQVGLQENSFLIGNIGRLVADKDQETLLKAFRKLVQKKFNGELVIVGDGPLQGHLKKKADDLAIADKVKFLGFRDDIEELLSIFDVYVLSSIREGVSLTLLEAMACHRPIVATKIGGNPEVVIDNQTGYIVPPGFPERIESAVMRLYANKGVAQEMGAMGRKRVEEKFSLKNMAEEYMRLYREIVR